MRELGHADSFRDLVVYRKACSAAQGVFQVTKSFPREEAYSLTDQIRRASRSIGSQIAEAWAKRRYEKHFVSKLTDADGEQQETQHWVDIAQSCGYLSEADAARLRAELAEIGRMLNSMIRKATLFCRQEDRAEESVAEYFVSDSD